MIKTLADAQNSITISGGPYSDRLERGKYAELPQLSEKATRWFRCPHCGKSLFPLRKETKIQNMPFRCKACKNDIEVNIE